MNHIYGVNKYTYARYCTETDIIFNYQSWIRIRIWWWSFRIRQKGPDPTGSGFGSATLLLGNLSLCFYDSFSIWSKSFLFFFCSLQFPRFLLSVYQIFPPGDIGSYPLRPGGGIVQQYTLTAAILKNKIFINKTLHVSLISLLPF